MENALIDISDISTTSKNQSIDFFAKLSCIAATPELEDDALLKVRSEDFLYAFPARRQYRYLPGSEKSILGLA
jgi:hypothetical protein